MGSAIASPQQLPSPSLGGRTGRLGANLLHSTTERRWRAQFHRVCKAARPPSAPGCARLRPVAPGCARLCRPVPSRTILHRPAPSHPAPFAAQPRRTPVPSHPSAIAPRPLRTPVPSRSSAIAPRPLRTPAPSHPGPSRHFFNRCHCFSRRHLPRKPTLIQPYSLRGNRWKSTTGQSLLTRCFFFSSC